MKRMRERRKKQQADSSKQHHPCHSESAGGGRRISWVEQPFEILRRLAASQNDSERGVAQFRSFLGGKK